MASNSKRRKMASYSNRLKLCSDNEDRISGMPDAVLCHILSFLSTREAVKTSVLSHRWNNVWASVPIVDVDEEQYQLDYLYRIYLYRMFGYVGRNFSKDLIPEYDPDWFSQFVNRVLLLRCSGDIHRFRLVAKKTHDISHIYAWIATAIRRNVVELDLSVGTPSEPHFEIPKSIFMCSTLVRFKLWLRGDIKVMTPTSSNCFPSLKFLHVTVRFPDSDSMEKLFSRCLPVLEELIIDGKLQYATAFNLDISAPKLKRLQIQLKVRKFVMDFAANDFVCQIFVNVDAPNLEEVDICFDALVSFSLKNAKCLHKANIEFFYVQELKDHDCFPGLADRIRQILAGICDAKYLTVRAPLLAALGNGHQHLLPTFNNLNYLELELHTCQCLQSLATVLMISPHLEHLKISQKWELYSGENNYCGDDNEDELEQGWNAPETVPVCLILHLKTICLWDFQGCPDDMEVAKYLVKHGKALNNVTIHTPFSENKEMKSQSLAALWSKFSKFPRGSKTCKIEFRIII
ncbi:PREDICTED: F-box/LRR-repeat protein At4g14096-like [Fragaria vesca subsp. vesca]|nr:PREDICTED: F-box/LRR-repeat protein At4g14103-like isoform X2 [Fragaria vesca subsp. vesca]